MSFDEELTGSENLMMIGRLFGCSRRTAKACARELLDGFALADAGGRVVRTWSGGMRRRLDLAASIVTRPDLLFLDEADQLANASPSSIVVGSSPKAPPRRSKTAVGSGVLRIHLGDTDQRDAAERLLAQTVGAAISGADPTTMTASVNEPARAAEAVATLTRSGIAIADFSLSQPSLDEVFLALTGDSHDAGPDEEETP